MKKINQWAAIWLIMLFFGLSKISYGQNGYTPQIKPVNIFKQDYAVNEGHSYNAEFLRKNKVKSFRVYNDQNIDKLPAGAGFTEYDFDENGMLIQKTVHEQFADGLQEISRQKYSYDEDGELKTMEEYYGDEFSSTLMFIRPGGRLQAVIEKNDDGATGNWSKFYWKDDKLQKKITYVNNKIVQVEYHFPATKSIAELTRIQEDEKRDVEGKSVFFYLYDNDRIITELWYAFSDDYVITRGYDETGRLTNVTKVKKGVAKTLDYKYDNKSNLLRIQESKTDDLNVFYRYKYDERRQFVQEEIKKTDTQILGREVYRYTFWSDNATKE